MDVKHLKNHITLFVLLLFLLKNIICNDLNSTKLEPNIIIKVNLTTINNKSRENIESEAPANPLNSIICDTNNDCTVDYDKKRVCVESICQCYPDYKWDHTSDMCIQTTCFNEKDCQSYDKQRECDRNGFCVCKKGYAEDEYNKVCVTSMISQLWFSIQISVSIFIPTVCLFLAGVMYYRENKRKKNMVPLLDVIK